MHPTMRNPQEARTDILAHIGMQDKYFAPMCGAEEYRDGSRKTIVSFDCYMVGLNFAHKVPVISIVLRPYGTGGSYSHLKETLLYQDGFYLTISKDRHHNGEIMPLSSSMTQEELPYYRTLIFGSHKRKYTPAQRDELIARESDKEVRFWNNVTTSFRVTRAVLASMLETHGVHDAHVDFALLGNVGSVHKWEMYSAGIAMMCGNTFIVTYVHRAKGRDYEYIAATHCVQDGKMDDLFLSRIDGDGVEGDIFRHIAPALLKIVEAAAT